MSAQVLRSREPKESDFDFGVVAAHRVARTRRECPEPVAGEAGNAERILPYREVVRLIRDVGAPLAAATVPLAEAVGRVTARTVVSTETSPNADLSAMDGYAARSVQLHGNTPVAPYWLPIVGVVMAGDQSPPAATADGVVRITTGALLPDGYDTVIPIEAVTEVSGAIEVSGPVAAGANVRRRGEDHRPGDVLLDAGRCIGPAHVLLLANVGCTKVAVVRRPRVAVLATGSELVEDLSAALRPGQVRNSNARYLMGALCAAGCQPVLLRAAGDDPGVIAERVRDALDADQSAADLVLTIGGVSRGAADFVPAALAALHAKVLFHGVAMRPGKPVLCARLPERGAAVFGLPGNPLAVLATFRALVIPFLRALHGQPPAEPVAARLGAAVTGRPGLTRFVLGHRTAVATATASADGTDRVAPMPRQKASEVAALRHADRWLVVPPEVAELPAGAEVETLPL